MKISKVEDNKLIFAEPLKQAQIIGRPNRFIVIAELPTGEVIDCHCAVPGTIGGVVLDGLFCLVSGPYPASQRNTPYSVEAVSFYHPEDALHQWVGISQGSANNYVEAALEANLLSALATPALIKREQKLGTSRIDFRLDDNMYLEVKMPIDNLQLDLPKELPRKWPVAGKGLGRADRQAFDLTTALEEGKRSAILNVFCYDNDGKWREWPYQKKKTEGLTEGQKIFKKAREAGLETWRVSFKQTETHLEFLRLVQVTQH